ncbi:MAG: hypothetical protein H7175_15585 [Burkholderiales bacterium]|nr:hypothetical protein [Anaerolineae bacterium]
MGYELSAFIARQGTFLPFRELSDRITVAPLEQGFELLLHDMILREALNISYDESADESKDLPLDRAMIEKATEWSQKTPISYVEAEFLGGNGYQHAALWRSGALALLPSANGEWFQHHHVSKHERPINSVLRVLGVLAGNSEDEFAALGLNRYRDPSDWFEAFTPYSSGDYDPYLL